MQGCEAVNSDIYSSNSAAKTTGKGRKYKICFTDHRTVRTIGQDQYLVVAPLVVVVTTAVLTSCFLTFAEQEVGVEDSRRKRPETSQN